MSRSDRKSKRKARFSVDETDPNNAITDSKALHATEVSTAAEVDRSLPPDPAEIIVRDLPNELIPSDSAEWPFRHWPVSLASRAAGFQVVIRRSVLNEISRHGQSTTDVEVCGVVAGNVFRDDFGSYLLIEAAVRGNHAGSSSANVTFTAETWNHIQGIMEKDHADLRVVGWYHTHPGFGIFLSDMDLFIHGNFFNLPWQVAFVYDPISREEGLFIWRDSKTVRVPFLVEEDVEKELATVPVSAEITAAALADFSRRMQKSEKRQKTLAVVLAFIALIALAWPLVLYTIFSENKRIPPAGSPAPVVVKHNGETGVDPTLAGIVPSATATVPPSPSTTQPITPTTDPVTESLIHPMPATIPTTTQASVPFDPANPLTTTPRPANVAEKSDVPAPVIRPTTPINKGPRILEGPADSSPLNTKP